MTAAARGALRTVLGGGALSEEEMASVVGDVMRGEVAPELTAGLLCALAVRGETVEELTGAARAMRQAVTRVTTPSGDDRVVIDTCGTGGDGAGTFNISTAAAFVVAGCGEGLTVAKHGNRAVSSKAGSADVLEALGVDVDMDVEQVERCLERLGLGFLFARKLHPAMKHAAPVRRALGVRTLFNLVGPLTNPAFAPRQVMGVFDGGRVETLARVLGRLGAERAWVVHGHDGLDEITLTGPTSVAEWKDGEVRCFEVTPEHAGLARCTAAELAGGDAAENAVILRGILDGTVRGPGRDIVLLNAGAALVVADRAADLASGVERAARAIDDGGAAAVLEGLRKV